MQIDKEVLAVLNEDELIGIRIPVKLYNKDPYTTELLIKKDKESGNYKTEVFNPKVLGKSIEIVAPTMDELRAKLVDYYQSVNYDVDFEEGTAAYLTDDERVVNKAFTESKNESKPLGYQTTDDEGTTAWYTKAQTEKFREIVRFLEEFRKQYCSPQFPDSELGRTYNAINQVIDHINNWVLKNNSGYVHIDVDKLPEDVEPFRLDA